MGADSGDSGGGGGGSEKEEKSSGKTVASVQAQINAALDASGGEWTSELNDLVAERESLKGASGDKGTATYNMFGDVVSEGAPSDVQLQEQSKFAQQQVQPTVTTTPDPFDPFTYADDDGTIPTVFDNVALGATPAAATTTEEGIPLGPEDFAPYPEEKASFTETIFPNLNVNMDDLSNVGKTLYNFGGRLISDLPTNIGNITEGAAGIADFIGGASPLANLSEQQKFGVRTGIPFYSLFEAVSPFVQSNEQLEKQLAKNVIDRVEAGGPVTYTSPISKGLEPITAGLDKATDYLRDVFFPGGIEDQLATSIKGTTPSQVNIAGPDGGTVSNLAGQIGGELGDVGTDVAVTAINPYLGIPKNLLEGFTGTEQQAKVKIDNLINTGALDNNPKFKELLESVGGNKEAAAEVAKNIVISDSALQNSALNLADAIPFFKSGAGIFKPIVKRGTTEFVQEPAQDAVVTNAINQYFGENVAGSPFEDFTGKGIQAALSSVVPNIGGDRSGVQTSTKVDSDAETEAAPSVDTESTKVQSAPDSQDVNIQVGGIPTLLTPEVISPELSGPKLITQRPVRIPDYGPPSVYNPNISKTAGQLAVTPLGIESAYTGQKAIEPPRLGLPDLTSPDATSLDVIAADQAIKGMLANNNLQIDPQILNNIKQTTNLSDADLNNLVLSNQGDLTKVANLPTLTTGQPGEVDPFVFDGEILGGEPSTETVTPTKDRDFVDADFEDIKTEVGPVKTTTVTPTVEDTKTTTFVTPTVDKDPTPTTETEKDTDTKKPKTVIDPLVETTIDEQEVDKEEDTDKGTPGQTDQVTTIPVKNNANDKDESPFICPEGYEAVKQNGVWICQPVEKAAKVQRGRPTVGTRPYVTRPGFARRIRS